MAGDGQGVTITELTGERRTLTLTGRNRPDGPVTVSDEQRATQTWYPGNRRASVQVMGDKGDPIVLRGRLTGPIETPDGVKNVRDLLHGLRESGSQCRLVWGDRIQRIVRVKRVSFEWYQENRARYEVTLEVDERLEAARVIPLRAPPKVLADLRAGMEALQEASGVLRLGVSAIKLAVQALR